MRSFIILSLGALLLFGVIIIMAQQKSKRSGSDCPPSPSPTSAEGGEQASAFDCLPDDIKLKDVVSYGIREGRDVTVQDKLVSIKAKCENGKLVDEDHKEIRFFRLQCWGNPPADYEERQQRQQEELKELEKKYKVIVMSCNPRLE
jgi:hypothetical protein